MSEYGISDYLLGLGVCTLDIHLTARWLGVSFVMCMEWDSVEGDVCMYS